MRKQERNGGKVWVAGTAKLVAGVWQIMLRGIYRVFRQMILWILTAENPPSPAEQAPNGIESWSDTRWDQHEASKSNLEKALRYMFGILSEAIIDFGWPSEEALGLTGDKAKVGGEVPTPKKRVEFIRISRGGDMPTFGVRTVIKNLVAIRGGDLNVQSERRIDMNGDFITNPASKSWCHLEGVQLVVVDEILAGGTSSVNAVNHVLEMNKGKPAQIIFACVYALKDGIRALQKAFPGIIVICCFVANRLDKKTHYGKDPDIGDGGAKGCDNQDRPKEGHPKAEPLYGNCPDRDSTIDVCPNCGRKHPSEH